MYYVIVRLFGLWYIAAFENGVMQYSIYGGYKREQDAKRQATIHKINISARFLKGFRSKSPIP